MKILVAHNYYTRRAPSGENEAVDTDVALLRDAGHDVRLVALESDATLTGSTAERVRATRATLREGGPTSFSDHLAWGADVLHVHNAFPFLSTGALEVVRRSGTPIVATLHNYRLSCMAGLHFRDGRLCHACDDAGNDLPAVRHGCYRDSRVQSVVMHWQRRRRIPALLACDHFFVLTEHHRAYLLDRFGTSPGKVTVRGNPFPATEGPPEGADARTGCLFVGRLSAEKGVELLLDSWRAMGPAAPLLRIVGDGPLRGAVADAVAEGLPIVPVGKVSQEEVAGEMRRARALVVPSTCYEGLPRAVVEAFGVGLPVVATGLGGLRTVVGPDTGRVTAADPIEFGRAVQDVLGPDDRAWTALSVGAWQEYQARYTPEVALALLLEGYARAAEIVGTGV